MNSKFIINPCILQHVDNADTMNYPDNSKTRREFVVDYTSLCTSTPRPTTSSSASQTPRPRPTPRTIPRTTSRTTPKPEQGPVSAPTPAPTSSSTPVQRQIRGPRSRLKRSTIGDALFGKLCVLYKRGHPLSMSTRVSGFFYTPTSAFSVLFAHKIGLFFGQPPPQCGRT